MAKVVAQVEERTRMPRVLDGMYRRHCLFVRTANVGVPRTVGRVLAGNESTRSSRSVYEPSVSEGRSNEVSLGGTHVVYDDLLIACNDIYGPSSDSGRKGRGRAKGLDRHSLRRSISLTSVVSSWPQGRV